jgi:hypothetical protein
MNSLLNTLQIFTGRRAARLVVVLFVNLVLMASIALGLRVASADTFNQFGITEQSRVGKLLKQILPRAGSAVAKMSVPAAPFATLTVTNGNDTGAGSLRDTIAAAASGDTIVFSGVTTVTLTSGQLTINKNLTISGDGANLLTVQSTRALSSTSRVFNISSGFTVGLSGLTISGGNVSGAGGGILNAGTLTITACAISNNSANSFGGGIRNTATGTLNVSNSTISNNTTTKGTNAAGGIDNGGTLNLTNSTVSGNSSTVSPGTGGIWSGGTATVINSTITNNFGASPSDAAGGVYRFSGTFTVLNSIIAANQNNTTVPDVIGTFVSSGYNLIGNRGTVTNFNQTGDQTGTGASPLNPLLSPLAHYGGTTQTHALIVGSPAIDVGDNCVFTNTCSPTLGFALLTDQRGATRQASSVVDIGAYERQAGLLYVMNQLNGGANQIYGYSVNESTGALTLLSGFPVASGGNGGSGAPVQDLTIDPLNGRLYALNGSSGTMSVFQINGDGSLTPMPFSPITVATSLTTVLVHPSGSPVIVGRPLSGTPNVYSFNITATTATAAAGSPYTTSADPFTSAFSRDGNYFYTGGTTATTFAGYSVNSATGVLTALAGSPFASGSGIPSNGYATDSAGRLFTGSFTELRAFTTASGVPTGVTGNPFASGLSNSVGGTVDGVLHPNQNFYYVADRPGNRVGAYQIAGSGAATTLAAVAGSPFAAGGTETSSIVFNSSGSYLFAANATSRNVTTYSVNSGTGALTVNNTQPANTLGATGRLAGIAYIGDLTVNNTPTIAAQTGVSRQQGSPVSNSQIATVSDAETAAGSLTVTVTSANPSNSVTVSNIVNTNGTVTANVVADCTATNASFTLQVSDGSATATTTLNVTVTANAAPTLTYGNASVNFGNSTTVGPATGPTDNGSISTIVVQSVTPSTAPGTLTVNNTTGVVSVPNNVPAGGYTVTIRVTDNCGLTTDAGFMLTVNNTPPTISDITNQTINEDGATGALAFTIGDGETPAASLTLSGSSSNTALVPNANIVFGGAGASRTVTVTPAANQSGTATITITVTDANGATASDTFLLTVNAVNDPPSISDIANQTISEDAATAALAFTVGDTETPAGSLTLSGTSSNTTLVPNANIVFGGAGASRTVTVTPAANQNGTATITVTVTDANSGTASDTFTLTVNSVNDLPTITDIANQTINEDGTTGALAFTIGDVETPTVSLNVSGSSSNTTLVPNANIVFGGSNGSRTVTVTPAANQSGTATITITVTDANSGTASDTFTLTVNAVNDPPTITDIANQTINEDGSTGALAFTVGDTETAAGSLTLSGSSSNTTLVPNGNITFNGSGANRTVTVTPAANQFGTATITITVTDAASSTASDTFTLTVNAVNDPPTISDIANQTISENSATGALSFTVGDVETPAASLLLTGSSSNTTLVPNGNISFNGSGANRTVTVTPATNQFGTATITVTVSDGDSGTASDAFVLTVTSVNSAPTITDISNQTINEDGNTGALAFTIGDVETPTASLTVSGSSSNTALVPIANIVFGGSNGSRTVTVTPAANQSGTATITVTVTDADSGTASDAFTLTVNAVNDPPTISDIANQTTNEDIATGAISFTVGDVETPAASLSLSGSSSNTTLVPNANIVFGGSNGSRTVTVTPAANQSGSATITITVTDANSGTASDTFLLTVNAVNDPPTISDIANQTINENTATGALSFTIGDVETPAASLLLTGSSSNTALVPNANISFNGSGANRTVTVTPAANQNGTATITITVTDADSGTASDTFVLTATSVNSAPTITDIANQTINEDGATSALSFTIGDVETPAASLTLSGSSSNTTLVPNANIVFGGSGANRTVTVTPAANQNGSATITLTVTDADSGSASDTFLLTINALNDPPTISDMANQTVNEDTATGALSFTIGDLETAASSLTLSGSSSNTTLVPNANIVFGGTGANRTVNVTPMANQSGTATITVTITDAESGTASDTFTLTVNAVNDLPTISDIANQTINENTSTGALSFTIGDAETPAASLTLAGSSSNTTLVPNANIVFNGSGANRTVTVSPAANQNGTATITVTVTDGNSGTASDTFVLTVTSVNSAPTITDIANQTINEDAATGLLSFTVGDVETPAGSLTVSGSSSNTTLLPNANIVFNGSGANRTVTVTPAANQSGTAIITVTVADADSGTVSDTFTLTVNAVNDLPTISDIANQTTNEDTATGALSLTIGDVETPAASLSLSGSSSNTTLLPNANIVFNGSGANRTVTVSPAANQSGTATITVTVSDANSGTATDTFSLTVSAVNDPPTITDIANQAINEDGNTGALSFTVGDAETAAGSLTLTGSSSNTTLVPNANIVFGGSNGSRTVTVTPAANQSGTATITLTVTDANSGMVSDTFTLTVNAVNDPPTISDLANQAINENGNTGALNFTVGDMETAVGSLTLSGSSSNTTLVPNTNIVFGGTSTNRSVTVTPTANQSGTATITITVTDANSGTASDSFVLTVNDPPTITASAVTRQQGNQPTNLQIATVLDTEDAEETLTVTVAGGTTATSNGVTINNLTVNAAGQVKADLAVTCTASNASFTLAVSDSRGASATATLNVTVPANTAPAVGNYPNSTVVTGGTLTITPDVPPTDNNTVVSVTAAATPNSFTGSFSGNTSSGGVTVTNANPAGSYTLTVTLTDNCGATTTRSFMLTVSACGAVLSKQRELFAANSSNNSFAVTIDGVCSWTATSDNPAWITVTAPVGGFAGNGTVSYSVASNPNSTRRTGSITVAGQTFRVWQGAQYGDVPPTHAFYDFIGKLSALGITLGCGNGNYCPDANTTREQMAIFIERAIGITNPPVPTQQTFQDVPPTLIGYPFIEDFIARGITQGCSAGPPRLFCPTGSVTREQVAIFILRGLGVFTPPAGPATATFGDVPNSGATDYSYEFIEEFVKRGITSGCAAGPPRLYCPTALVTRGQMAVFLVRAFGM